jgi:hypothetical protein
MTSEATPIDPTRDGATLISQKDKNAYVSNFIDVCEEEDFKDTSL